MIKNVVLPAMLALLFMGCAEDLKQDASLDGMWATEESSVDAFGLSPLASDSYVYEFNGESLKIYKSKSSDMSSNIEVEVGKYERDEDLVKFQIEAHSCVNAELNDQTTTIKSLSKSFQYVVNEDGTKVTITFAPNKKVTLVKLEQSEQDNANNLFNSSTTGCYITAQNGQVTFRPALVERPLP